jgi:hypothetical protein
MSEGTRKKLREKEVRGSASAEEATANIKDDEEAEHILRLIDAELKGTPEYKECNNDPKRALAIVFNAKIGQIPKKITKDVLSNLKDKLDAIFASLPRTRVLSLEHFYANKLRVLVATSQPISRISECQIAGFSFVFCNTEPMQASPLTW